MPIVYANRGWRDYHQKPVYPYARSVWEIQLIAEGAAVLMNDDGEHAVAANVLNVFAPEVRHGWGGHAGALCRIAVLHMAELPAAMAAWLGERRVLQVCLSAAASVRVEHHVQAAMALSGREDVRSALRGQALTAEILLTLIEAAEPVAVAALSPAARIEQCLTYWREHLHEGVGIAEAATALGVSTAHLRRLFHAVSATAPQAALAQVRAERVAQYLNAPKPLKREAIAQAVGLSSAAALCRFMRRMQGEAWAQFGSSTTTQ